MKRIGRRFPPAPIAPPSTPSPSAPSDNVKADEAVTKFIHQAQSEGDARGAGASMMMRRGLTLRHHGATAKMCTRSRQRSWPRILPCRPSSRLCISAGKPTASFAALDKGPQSHGRSLCGARLFPACLAASVRAGIWNMAQNFLISTRFQVERGGVYVPLCPSLLMCLQRGGAGTHW